MADFTPCPLQGGPAAADNPGAAEEGGNGMLRCTGCANPALITIRMRIAGREIVFHRCARCESNTWEASEGDVLSLDEVLELARAAR